MKKVNGSNNNNNDAYDNEDDDSENCGYYRYVHTFPEVNSSLRVNLRKTVTQL